MTASLNGPQQKQQPVSHIRSANTASSHLESRNDGDILIYNRIPKTGSTSLMSVAYELQSALR